MDNMKKALKDKDGETKPESHTLMQDYKSSNSSKSNEKNPNFCPGLDKCKKLTCNHLHLRESDIDRMVKTVVKKCQDSGYNISEHFATQWLEKYPGDPNLAIAGAKYDIDARETSIKESGRVSFQAESAVAVVVLKREERDAVLDFIEKEERLFKDFEKNGEKSVWALRCKHHPDEVRGRRWYESCAQEVKYRASRQKHFGTLRDKVAKGEITQEYMDICLSRIDTGYAQKQYNRATEQLEKDRNASMGDGNATKGSQNTASSSSASDFRTGQIAGGKGTEFKVATASTMQSRIPIRTATPTQSKGKSKQAYVEDEAEPDDTVAQGEVLRALADQAFRTIYGNPLPSCIKLDQLERFMNSLPMHNPMTHDIVEFNRFIDAGDSELLIDIFEKHVSEAERFMEHRHLLDVDNTSSEVANLIEDKQEQSKEATTIVEGKVKLENAPITFRDEFPTVAKSAAKGEPSLFKTMAKAKVESKRKEDGTFDEEVMSSEMRARDALASGSAAKSAKVHKAAKSAKSKKARKAVQNGSKGGTKKDAPEDNIRYRIKLAEEDGEMAWPPMAANYMETGFDTFLAYHGEASSKLLRALVLQQIDIVGGLIMIEDGPGDAESVSFIKEMTTITSDRVAQLFLGMGANSAALATRLYSKFETEINHYFVEQSILPFPADFENEALRFAIWMYMARDLDDDNDDKKKEHTKKTKKEELEKVECKDNGEESGEESEGLYDA